MSPPAPPSPLARFIAGLTDTSTWTGAGMLLVGLLTFVGLAAGIGPSTLASGLPVLRWDDEFADMGGRLVRLADDRPATPVVWLVGSSATREALSSPQELTQAIERAGGPALAVEVLAAGGLYPEEALAALDHAPIQQGDLVIAEVSPRNLALPASQVQQLLDSPRLPLDGETLDRFAADHGLRPHRRVRGSHLLSFPNFWAARVGTVVHLWTGAPRVEFHLAHRVPPPDPKRWDQLIARVAGWGTRCTENADLHVDTYAALADRVTTAGARLALLDAPRNPEVLTRLGEDGARDRDTCQDRIQALASTLSVPRWEPAQSAALQGREFIDHAHVVAPAGRVRFTHHVATSIAQMLAAQP
jgi:hypothetical protein